MQLLRAMISALFFNEFHELQENILRFSSYCDLHFVNKNENDWCLDSEG